MSSRFPHTCTITRPNPADVRAIDAESGQPVGSAPTPVTVYSGRCRYTSDGEAVRRMKGGRTDLTGEGVLTLPKRAATFSLETDTALIEAGGVSLTARIERADYFFTQEVRLLVTPETPAT